MAEADISGSGTKRQQNADVSFGVRFVANVLASSSDAQVGNPAWGTWRDPIGELVRGRARFGHVTATGGHAEEKRGERAGAPAKQGPGGSAALIGSTPRPHRPVDIPRQVADSGVRRVEPEPAPEVDRT